MNGWRIFCGEADRREQDCSNLGPAYLRVMEQELHEGDHVPSRFDSARLRPAVTEVAIIAWIEYIEYIGGHYEGIV